MSGMPPFPSSTPSPESFNLESRILATIAMIRATPQESDAARAQVIKSIVFPAIKNKISFKDIYTALSSYDIHLAATVLQESFIAYLPGQSLDDLTHQVMVCLSKQEYEVELQNMNMTADANQEILNTKTGFAKSL